MLEGFPSIAEQIGATELSALQAAKVSAFTLAVLLAKYTRGTFDRVRGQGQRLTDGLDTFRGNAIAAKGTRRRETHGGFHLSTAEVSQFERDGILGPIRVMDAADARALARRARELHAQDWLDTYAFGPAVRAALKRHGDWDFERAGLYQALYHPELWDVLCSDALAQPMQSLLGDDVLCWRSQLFDKAPGQAGTFWHQAGRFREASLAPKLQPTAHTVGGDTMVQLTIWMALDDVDEENGALLFAPGTFRDGRFEAFCNRVLDDQTRALLTRSPEGIRKIVHLLNHSASDFVKAQAGFEWACELLPDLFADAEPKRYPMRAGEALIFTSLNMHGSLPNITRDRNRLAFVGRITTNDVKVLPGLEYDIFRTGDGPIRHSTAEQQCIQIAGSDRFGFNRIKAAPELTRERRRDSYIRELGRRASRGSARSAG